MWYLFLKVIFFDIKKDDGIEISKLVNLQKFGVQSIVVSTQTDRYGAMAVLL